MSWLTSIVAQKQREIHELRSGGGLPITRARPPLSLSAALRRGQDDPLRLLCEHKRRSPSAGALSTTLGPAERALVYARGGAAAISVLCDETFFDGGYTQLAEIHTALHEAALPVPLLAKEFVLHETQVDAAFAAGADAVLLIARLLSPARMHALYDYTRRLGLEVLVEVHTQDEADHARAMDAWVVGVNARDLDTLTMDPERAHEVLASLEPEIIGVHLSGLSSAADVANVAAGPAQAALIGEVLMRQDDPRALLSALLAATSA